MTNTEKAIETDIFTDGFLCDHVAKLKIWVRKQRNKQVINEKINYFVLILILAKRSVEFETHQNSRLVNQTTFYIS